MWQPDTHDDWPLRFHAFSTRGRVTLHAHRNGELERDEYEHRFARMISELRDRRIGGSRAEIHSAINPLIEAGEIDRAEYERFVSQLGLA